MESGYWGTPFGISVSSLLSLPLEPNFLPIVAFSETSMDEVDWFTDGPIGWRSNPLILALLSVKFLSSSPFGLTICVIFSSGKLDSDIEGNNFIFSFIRELVDFPRLNWSFLSCMESSSAVILLGRPYFSRDISTIDASVETAPSFVSSLLLRNLAIFRCCKKISDGVWHPKV